MKRLRTLLPLAAIGLLVGCSSNDKPTPGEKTNLGTAPGTATGGEPGKRFKIGYVLHGLNDFTASIKRGAEDAGKALGVDVEVVGPSEFKKEDAIAQFEGFVQKKMDGIVTVPMPSDSWVTPIQQAVDAKIPVATANITSPNSAAQSWFGQDEKGSGVLLAKELIKQLEAAGKKSGKIVVGICVPGEPVLDARYQGLQEGFKGTAYTLTEPSNVMTGATENYGQWESLAGANKDAVAFVGLCSMDLPNLSKLRERGKATWLVAGYDLVPDALEGVKNGTVNVIMGQNPYLQGYLPVLALVQQIRDGKAPIKGWVDVGTEIVTKDNAESLIKRETDHAEETKWYSDHIAKNFSDLSKNVKPIPGAKP
jgi:ABC-type sugar transport system substrate-binding protein